MPVFLDSHHGSELPSDGIREFLRRARNATRDAFDVRPIDLYCGDNGRVFCLMMAPDESAVRQHHAEQGVICRRVRRVQVVRSTTDELTDEDRAIVRQMIVAEQGLAGPGLCETREERLRQVG
jgi:hypothetical protein